MENSKALLVMGVTVGLLVNVAVAIPFLVCWDGSRPQNYLFDQNVLWALLWWGIKRLQYRFARFQEVTDGSESCLSSGELIIPEYGAPLAIRRIGYGLLAVALLFCAANSLSAFYVRSLIEKRARFVSIEFYGQGELLWKENGGDDVSWPEGVRPRALVDTVCTLEKVSLILDGQPLDDGYDFGISTNWFWQEDYFFHYLEFRVPHIHDGSVLEIICGDLRRTIIFHVGDEESV